MKIKEKTKIFIIHTKWVKNKNKSNIVKILKKSK